MKTTAALLWDTPGTWDVREVDLDPPKAGEVLVKIMATGLCHSDDHFAQGDIPFHSYPACGGHEGAGIVEAVGPGVTRVAPGDHIVTSFIPACGRCRNCVTGRQNICVNGALITVGTQLDGTFRMHADGHGVAQNACISTFSEWTVMPEVSATPIRRDVPFEVAAIVGCAVPTGWGSAVRAAGIVPGDVVIVMGVGGIGINAVQGARHVGAHRVIAVDPVESKRELALKLGATDAVAHIAEADELARSLTNGQGADQAIVCVGVVTGEHVGEAYATIKTGGTVVLVSAANHQLTGIPVPLLDLALHEKRIQGALYGMGGPAREIPLLLDLYKAGSLKLDELVTRTYDIEQINEAYADMHRGLNVRGVVSFAERHRG
ncbi:NDMA-dependent alcohol dehydrogenase [Pseudonocardia endophytica]|uniref:S-(Hydroxymethyl)glutathione dehydrogenase/alcohol dehydrogenase n=1 Tax=Pseudonocardia endophytica TaxID=401976 RepID=A0A4V2PIS6_PSEEN|nr:NDMA-dependent alcohol dehydrogenase [Pseudonocardia endophytica]TCK25756.1 S-(hydroxymethyl)glutathione dehydrogenase/alcohol dehydrogenase [Pseudonocardia endophytica]